MIIPESITIFEIKASVLEGFSLSIKGISHITAINNEINVSNVIFPAWRGPQSKYCGDGTQI